MTAQCRDKITSQSHFIDFSGYEVCGIYEGESDLRAEYSFSCKPQTISGIINSACWKGYVAYFRLDALGTLLWEKYDDLAGNSLPVNEQLCGKFWLKLGQSRFSGVDRFIHIPFENGRIVTDPMAWEGDRELLKSFRNRSESFSNYGEALAFLKGVGTGQVTREAFGNGFMWDSEGRKLNKTQAEFIHSHNLRTSVWKDPDTGLVWIFQPGTKTKSRRNLECFGGYADWRTPSLRELKTLSANVKNELGMLVKPGPPTTVSGMYRSSTRYHSWNEDDEGALWDFETGVAVEYVYHDGKIKWDGKGTYAGFEPSGYKLDPHDVLVAGADVRQLPEWAISLIMWAEANEMHSFPESAEHIAGLDDLVLPGSGLPDHFLMLTSLRSLAYPKCTFLPEELFSLEKLENLTLGAGTDGNNHAAEFTIGEGIGNLASLKSLTIQNVGVKALPSSIGNLLKLRYLKIFRTDLESLPESIGNLSRLEELSLRCNELQCLPATIIRLNSIKSLDVSYNRINRLPEEFGLVPGLTNFEAEGNHLCSLPESFAKLSSLEKLTLSKCGLDTLPNCIHALKKMTFLDVSFNSITMLPEWIGNLHQLSRLNVAANVIKKLPKSVTRLSNLEYINISGTKLLGVPLWLGEMSSLQTISAAKIPNFGSKQRTVFPGKRINYYYGPLS